MLLLLHGPVRVLLLVGLVAGNQAVDIHSCSGSGPHRKHLRKQQVQQQSLQVSEAGQQVCKGVGAVYGATAMWPPAAKMAAQLQGEGRCQHTS